MNYRKKYPRKTKGNKDWLCKEYKSFKSQSGHKAKHKYVSSKEWTESSTDLF